MAKRITTSKPNGDAPIVPALPDGERKKTVCPVSREKFRTEAKALDMIINGKELKVSVKDFSTGSLGWYENSKIQVDVGGVACTVQLGLTFTLVGSKDLPS